MKAVNDIVYYYSNKNFRIENKKENKRYYYSLGNSFDIVETVYKNFGFKGLNTLLINHHMNKYKAYTLFSNDTGPKRTALAVAFIDKNNNTIAPSFEDNFLPDILLMSDGQRIENKEEMREIIIELTKEKLMTKGEAVC